ncbi:MAG: DUF4097 domain-containing protein [Ruminococcaceae bacterium]|nr:DUF4097 domain-containing protein [Oscillospiraceae bacterium]
MKKRTVVWIVVAVSLVLIGGGIFSGAMALAGWDFSLLSTQKYTTKAHQLEDAYTSISVRGAATDVEIVPSADSETTVTCYQPEKVNQLVWVNDGVLNIDMHDERKWYDHIGIFFDTPKVTIAIPAGEYARLFVETDTGDVTIPKEFQFQQLEILGNTGDIKSSAAFEQGLLGTTTGDICIADVTAGKLSVTTATGDVVIRNVTAEGLSVNVTTGDVELDAIRSDYVETNGETGDLSMTDVITEGVLAAVRTTGSIRFDKCDGGWLLLRSKTGDISGSLLTDKIFHVRTATGSVNVPQTKEGGECRVETTTGDIRIKIAKV